MAARYLLGIDSGTSVVKSVVFDLSGHEIAVARRDTPTLSPVSGWSEIDMTAVWDAAADTVAEVVQIVGSETIAAVGISGTACGVWPVTEAGNPARRAILWNDGRAGNIVTEWQASGLLSRVFDISGNAIFPGYPIASLRWLVENEPHVLEQTRWLLFHKDWLRYKLTGAIYSDLSDVSYFPGDIHKRDYSDEVLELTGLTHYRDRLPSPRQSHDVVGEISDEAAARTGLRAGTPVVAGSVDVVASALGGGAFRPGQACSILGTSFLNNLVSAAPTFVPRESGVQACMPGNTWLRSLVNTTGTISINWLVNNLAAEERAEAERSGRNIYDLIEATIQDVPPGANGIVFLPYLNTAGIISPFTDPNARAQFFGISMEHTRADLMRAVYEGVALAMRDCYESMGQPVDELMLVGGGARSAFWSQMFADATGKRILVSEGTEFGARGAAVLAGVGTGLFASFEDATAVTVRIGRVYEPRSEPAHAYEAVYELYCHLYNSARESWRLRRRVLDRLK